MAYKNVIPWGRSLKEYKLMFSLTEEDLERHILDCAAGPASFNTEMHQRGYRVTSIDPLYDYTADEIEAKIYAAYPEVTKFVADGTITVLWDQYKHNNNELQEDRLNFMQGFLKDFTQGKGEGRYQPFKLPKLPFKDKSFDLAISSNFLFLYSYLLDLEIHIESIKEMCRVATECRLFPTVDLQGNKSPFLDNVIGALTGGGYQVDLISTDYNFISSPGIMMKVTY